ncbi:SigB/SigF/SigG family RNA polymerase sigma factor [Actinoplanes sp. NPDC026623]|uniref:SigB/SigF/SigG family RNA polymerase sigma factor n=1 Tax=Actinoplanes sp. NPDC026623 TaxID=3155610 RepID=UPI00340C6A4C
MITKTAGRAPQAGADAGELLLALAAVPVGDPSRPGLRARVIEAWLPLAGHLASRYAGRGEPDDDLLQTAVVGLIKAIDKFDPGLGTDFPGYAIPTVIGEIKRHFRDRTWAVRMPRRLRELSLAVTAATGDLTHRLCRSPTVAEIAAHLEITEEEVLEGLEGARAQDAASLSVRVPGAGFPGEHLGVEERGYELAEARVALGPALASLDERGQRILTLRFYGNLTQTEIAEQVGISQMHVSRLIGRALVKLRGQFA